MREPTTRSHVASENGSDNTGGSHIPAHSSAFPLFVLQMFLRHHHTLR
jgi:hypothetical protein